MPNTKAGSDILRKKPSTPVTFQYSVENVLI